MSDAKDPSTHRATSVEDAKRELQASREALMHQMLPSTRSRRSPTPPPSKAPSNPGDLRVARGAVEATAILPPASVDFTKPEFSSRPIRPGASLSKRVTRSRSQTSSTFGATFGVVRHAFNAWWQFHPARAIGAIAEPFVEEFADRRPFRLLAISMVAGAAIAVVRPWRLISVGGIALAALKSSRVSSAALTFMADKARRD